MSNFKSDGLVKIAYAEDELSILELVCKHIDGLENCKVVIKSIDGQDLLDKIKVNPQIDLALLDVVLDGLDGYAVAREIKKHYPHVRILFYSQLKTELALIQMISSGAHGLVRKGQGLDNLKKGIQTVMKGLYFFKDIAGLSKASNSDSQSNNESLLPLSDTETTFLKYAASDLTYKQIAQKMKKEERQVDYLREHLFKKLHVQSRVGLVLIAVQSGIQPFLSALSIEF